MGLFNHKCKVDRRNIAVDDRWDKCPFCGVSCKK